MKTFLFVHGTGVREPGFSESVGLIEKGLRKQFGATNVRVEKCYWGGPVGSRLQMDGKSIPNFDDTRATDDVVAKPEDYDILLWNALYNDPGAELSVLAERKTDGGGGFRPGERPGPVLDGKVQRLHVRQDAEATERDALLQETGLAPFFDTARNNVTATPSYTAAIATIEEPIGAYCMVVARALVAASLRLYRRHSGVDTQETFALPFDTATRNRIVELLAEELGGVERGPLDWLKRQVGLHATGWVAGRRGRFSAGIAGGTMDILRYQAFPDPFRKFFRDSVARVAQGGDVIVIAHSLGGIIAVDALIENSLPAVRHLITVGSQSGVLFENNAMSALPYHEGAAAANRLPTHFPKWLNIYDDRDFLSYLTTPIFGSGAHDHKVNNGQPFPESHGAYWTNTKVWDKVFDFVNTGE